MDTATWLLWRAASKPDDKRRLLSQMLEENEPLAQKFTESFVRHSQLYLFPLRDDVLQAARIGLIRAVERWQPSKGAFSTCAYHWMRHEAQGVSRDATPVTRPKSADLPRHAQDRAAALYAREGRTASANEMGVPESRVKRAEAAARPFIGTSAPAKRAEHNRRVDPAMIVEYDAEGELDQAREMRLLEAFLSTLSTKDRKAFWTGEREDLTERAKAFVAKAGK